MFLLSAGSPMDPPLGSMPLNPLMRRRRCGGYRLVTRPGGRPAALSQPTQVRPEGCKQGQRGWAAFPPHLGGLGVCLPLGEGGSPRGTAPTPGFGDCIPTGGDQELNRAAPLPSEARAGPHRPLITALLQLAAFFNISFFIKG